LLKCPTQDSKASELQLMKCSGDFGNNAVSNLSETGLVAELDEVIRVGVQWATTLRTHLV